ncbi:MAG: 2-iminoacetate synthase ThiH [Verrucomicrobia bacterium]|nr:2-iminoacetate synthase ThiH [Verrucomicrobiota bacterium]
MSVAAYLNALPLCTWQKQARKTTGATVRQLLRKPAFALADFAPLLSPAAADLLEPLCQRSQTLTRQRFGKVIRLFAPLYLSNECINQCKYCGFSRDNPILRVTLTYDDVLREARALTSQGFRSLLLVAGEHPKFVSLEYLTECVRLLHPEVPSLSLEVGSLDIPDYRRLVAAGAEGLVIYQETYDRALYADLHPSGPKRNFDWRITTPERAYAAGFRRLGIGALFGLGEWQAEALAVAAHADYLLRTCWRSSLTISLPRLRPSAGHFQPRTSMTDRDLAQLVCALRLVFPDVGLVLSTRESPTLRNGLFPLGITLVSAGSHTEPGGYTGAGRNRLHHTRGGRIVELVPDPRESTPTGPLHEADPQFAIADDRSPHEIADLIRRLGYEPVWKDWDVALTA